MGVETSVLFKNLPAKMKASIEVIYDLISTNTTVKITRCICYPHSQSTLLISDKNLV